MKNHLIIGLGGTGGRVIRALRKRIMVENRSNDVPIPGRSGECLGLRYLYIDSSAEMMNPTDESWRVLGQSVQLPQSAQMKITGANIRAVLANPQTHPTIRPWIGSPNQWAKVPDTVISAGAGGQRRRLGRFLFAMKAAEFSEKLSRSVDELRRATGNSDVHVHIVTGLAGGTGGGSFIDVLTQVAQHQSITTSSHISLFAVLPERNTTWNAGNYYANGYASLLELNGLLIGKYRPCDLSTPGQLVTLNHQLLKGIYLISNENSDGISLTVDSDVPVMIADFLYERLLESEQGQAPIATNENENFGPELVPGTTEPQRARMFSSFGIKRVEYPENEIEEYLAANIARMASLQLSFNNWTDEFGFIDRRVQVNFRQRVEDKTLRERWRLTDDHLKYVLPVLDEDSSRAREHNWLPTLDAEWNEARDYYQVECKDLDRLEMLPRYHDLMEQQFGNGGFRRQGVQEFYRLRSAGRAAIAARIAELVEDELLRKWREGEIGWSLDDLLETLKSLREALEERRAGFEKAASDLRERIKSYDDELAEQRFAAADTSPITWPFKRSGILQAYAQVVSEYMVARTDLEATNFATSLIPAILEQIIELQNHIERVRTIVAEALERLRQTIDSRLRTEDANASAAAIRRFDPTTVVQLRDKILRDRSEMGRIASEIRRSLLDTPLLRNSPHFRTLLEELQGVALDQRLLERCDAMTKSVHDNLVQGDANRVLGVQLIQRLRTEFGGDPEKLDAFTRDIVAKAKPFARIDETEKVKDPQTVGAPPGAAMVTAIVVQRPKPPGYEAFLDSLDTSINATHLGIRIPDPSTSKPNALTAISVHSGMPIRFLEIAKFLKAEYQKRLDATVDLGKLEVHTEDGALELPDLFLTAGPPVNALSYLLLGQSLGIVFEEKHPQTGRNEIVLKSLDRDGFDQIDKIADKWADLPAALEHREFLTLKNTVDTLVAKTLVHQDKKREIYAAVVALVREVGDAEGQRSDRYTACREGASVAKKILGVED
ncbi:tubulin-like doman-containing protein [Magnetospirillum fulvum]|uniref:Tubulin like n=1 Tax=Magnetospirillum fulvum TaxID=1082 RepID=A0A1H6GU33_MAGFU|nr:tubulin-like doman-containing protein [Magnetospirillum fulvum]SEH25658.1 Tubulin like [Magnetospirillum fulvum]